MLRATSPSPPRSPCRELMPHPRIGWRQAAALWLAPLLWPGTIATAQEKPSLDTLQIALSSEEIAISTRLLHGFDEEFLQHLESGLPTELTYRFNLYRDRKRWFDGELAKSTYQIIAMYNAVSREYLVNFKHDGKLTETRVARTLEELERAMSSLDKVPIFSLATLPPKIQRTIQRSKVLVRARVELGNGTWLWIFPTTETTDWARSRKFTIGQGA